MAYDSGRGRLVLFSGKGGEGLFRDTWEWNGTSWGELDPADTRPSRRSTHAMAYDSVRERVVLFGGYTSFTTVFRTPGSGMGRVG